MFSRAFSGPNQPVLDRMARDVRTTAQPIVPENLGALLDFSSSSAMAISVSATTEFGKGWHCLLHNANAGVVTLTASGKDLFGGVASTLVLNQGDLMMLQTEGRGSFDVSRILGANSFVAASGSGNFTVPPGVYRIKYRLWGAGGGAAGSGSVGFGGGGSYAEGWMSVTPGALIAYAVGAAGSVAPTDGGNTTLGSVTAAGGTAGSSIVGSGGSASGGDLNISGGAGYQTSSSLVGGQAPFTPPASTPGGTSINGLSPGGGAAATTAGGSGSGGAGEIIIEWT